LSAAAKASTKDITMTVLRRSLLLLALAGCAASHNTGSEIEQAALVSRVSTSPGHASTSTSAGALTLTTTPLVPAPTAGNTLLLAAAIDEAAFDPVTMVAPAGWTAVYPNGIDVANAVRLYLFYKPVATGDGATVQASISHSAQWAMTVLEYAGVDGVAPIADQSSATGTGASLAVQASSPASVGGEQGVEIFANTANPSFQLATAGWTDRSDVASTGGSGNGNASLHVSDSDGALSVAAPSVVDASLGSARNYAAILVGLRPLVTHTLVVQEAGTGTGTVTSAPAGIACGSACSAPFAEGASVTLTASPDASSSFTGWSGGGCSGTGTCTLSLTADTTVTASFAASGGGQDVVLVDQSFHCTGPVNLGLVKVTIHLGANLDAVHLDSGCTGTIGRIEVDQASGDGIKIGQGAHDITIGGGYVRCTDHEPLKHQDGLQALGGQRVSVQNFLFDCTTSNNAQMYFNEGNGGHEVPTDITCDGCDIRVDQTSPQLHTLRIYNSARCGARNSTIEAGSLSAVQVIGAQGYVDCNNTIVGGNPGAAPSCP
jgi:hypothetical protein